MFAWGYKMKNSSITGLAAAAFFLLLGLPARRAAAEEKRWIGNVNLLLGAKTLEKDDWEPAEKQGEVGFELDFKRPDWPLSVALDLLGAAGEGEKLTGHVLSVDDGQALAGIGGKTYVFGGHWTGFLGC